MLLPLRKLGVGRKPPRYQLGGKGIRLNDRLRALAKAVQSTIVYSVSVQSSARILEERRISSKDMSAYTAPALATLKYLQAVSLVPSIVVSVKTREPSL